MSTYATYAIYQFSRWLDLDHGDNESPHDKSGYHHEDGNHVSYHAVTSIPS